MDTAVPDQVKPSVKSAGCQKLQMTA